MLLCLGAVICAAPIQGAETYGLPRLIRFLSLASLAVLADCHRMPRIAALDRIVPMISSLLGGRLATFLGDTSYGVYLLHLLVMLPVMQVVTQHPLSSSMLFLTTVVIVIPIVYLLAWLLHLWIERPGIHLGRQVLKAMRLKMPRTSKFA
jgi:peptidoglycan/LPS O-acetylase OafA/YrhL